MRGVHRTITTTFLVIIILGVAVAITLIYFLTAQKQQTTRLSNSDNFLEFSREEQASKSPEGTEEWKKYTSSKYSFEIKYPPELAQYANLSTEDAFIITYPGPADFNLFSIQGYKTQLADQELTWWKTEGSRHFPEMIDPKFSPALFSAEPDGQKVFIGGTEVYGKRKTPGGALVDYSLVIVKHKGSLLVITSNISQYENGKYSNIPRTFKLLE